MPSYTPQLFNEPDSDHLCGVLERILYLNEENHYCVGELKIDGKPARSITINGTLPGVQCGETLELKGSWHTHPQYGRQFKVKSFQSRLPATVYGIKKYLGSGLVPGIGKTYAEKIVDTFGLETLDVITNDSGRLREVPGIGPKRAKDIKKSWDDQHAVRDVLMFLQTYGVTVSQCLRLVKRYGNTARQVLESDPYLAAREIDGIGFKTADKIAINLGFANDSPKRIDAGILHALKELEADGHTGFPIDDLQTHATELLQTDAALVGERIQVLENNKDLRYNGLAGLIQLPHSFFAEEAIAQALNRVQNAPSALPSIKEEIAADWAQERAGFDFAPEQRESLLCCLTNKVSVLTGGPGTGKTTILKALVDILKAKHVRLMLASPTGRAAQRMTETTGAFASTIHRMLKWDPGQGQFSANEDKPLGCDFLIIDEASMLDTRLASAVLKALPTRAHVVFVGDIHQLPSVGSGNVLHDIIACGEVPTVELKQIFRQREESGIVSTAHRILAGTPAPPKPVENLRELQRKYDLQFIKASDQQECLQKVIELCRDLLPRWNIDAIKQAQVIAPMHRGICGIANLNVELQKNLNAQQKSIQVGIIRFQEGDKIIQTRNNYDKGIYNGDIGTVTHINTDVGTLSADFDGTPVNFERLEMGDLQPAYAISVHKSQGSEFPVVILPLLKAHFMLLQRNLLYTGLTRGKRKVFIVGDPVAYAMAVNNAESKERHTGLLSLLKH